MLLWLVSSSSSIGRRRWRQQQVRDPCSWPLPPPLLHSILAADADAADDNRRMCNRMKPNEFDSISLLTMPIFFSSEMVDFAAAVVGVDGYKKRRRKRGGTRERGKSKKKRNSSIWLLFHTAKDVKLTAAKCIEQMDGRKETIVSCPH